MDKIFISACLLGHKVRYDGQGNLQKFLLDSDNYVAFCPEVEGGLPIPREPAEIVGGTSQEVLSGRASVKTKTGIDVSSAFVQGAQKALDLCIKQNITKAVLAKNSPSCACTQVYDGTFSGKKIPGMGVCATLLTKNNIEVSEV